MADGPAVVTSTGIARMAGVGRAAVSNWRRRHADFPAPVGGSASSPTFDLAAVERWLAQQGKLVESSLVERTWRRIEVFSSAPQITDALCLAGALLLTRPGAGERAERAPIPTPARLLRDLKARSQAAAEALAPIILAAWSPQQKDLLRAVAELAGHGEPGDMFEFLHWRCVTARGVSVLDATPDAVAELMTDLAGVGQTVLDFSCGTGTMLRTQIRRAADTGATVRCFGQEPDPASARVALLRLLFAQDAARGSAGVDLSDPVVCQGDALLADAFGDLAADVVLSNPPFGIHDWGHEQLAYDPRWSYGLPPRTEPELAWVQHALAHLVPGGRAVLVMPPAAAARTAGRRIRGELVRRGALLGVVALPSGLVPASPVGFHLWVLRHPVAGEPVGSHALFVDGSAMTADTAAIREVVAEAWRAFTADPASVPARPGVCAAVPLIQLLDQDIDLTPRRHVPPPTAPTLDAAELLAHRTAFDAVLAELRDRLPALRAADGSSLATAPTATLADLVNTGGLTLIRPQLRPGPRAAPRARADDQADTEPALTGHDVTVGGPPTGTAPTAGTGADHRIRPGDVLVPTVSRAVVARVATDEQVGALAGGHVHVVRVDPRAFDPRFVAGVLASVRNTRRAARVATSTSDTLRIDVRRLRIPVLPIEAQRVYGEAFARIAEFDATVDRVADQGRDLARALTQGLIGGVLRPDT